MDYHKLLAVAIKEARAGLAEGGIPIGACLVDAQAGRKLAAGRKPPRPKAADADSGAARSGHRAR
jgi:tRNA(Arg) A34 adenosine deaminase TadA